jgi:hypothetical protein
MELTRVWHGLRGAEVKLRQQWIAGSVVTEHGVHDACVQVDAASVDDYLARQDAIRLASRVGDERCASLVEAMLREHRTA